MDRHTIGFRFQNQTLEPICTALRSHKTVLLGRFHLNGHTTGFRDKQLTEPQERSAERLLSEFCELDSSDSGNKSG